MKQVYLPIFILFTITIIRADVVDIKADHFYANDINKVAYFEGNARIKQGVNEFRASKILVHFNRKKKATKYEAEGGVTSI